MLDAGQNLTFGCSITLELVSNDYMRDLLESFEELAKKSFRCMFVASALDQDIQHLAVLIHRAPHIVCFPVNLQVHFIHVPGVAATRATTTQFIRVDLAEFEAPLPHRFLGHDDPTLSQKLFHITKTERKAKVEPDRMTDDFRREAVAFVIRRNGVRFHEIILAYGSTMFPS
jgi:hypothetical protein